MLEGEIRLHRCRNNRKRFPSAPEVHYRGVKQRKNDDATDMAIVKSHFISDFAAISILRAPVAGLLINDGIKYFMPCAEYRRPNAHIKIHNAHMATVS